MIQFFQGIIFSCCQQPLEISVVSNVTQIFSETFCFLFPQFFPKAEVTFSCASPSDLNSEKGARKSKTIVPDPAEDYVLSEYY